MKFVPQILLAVALLWTAALNAQTEKELDGEEITVEASFKPYVPKVDKIKVKPTFPKEEMKKPDFTYALETVNLNSEVLLKPITPARIRKESKHKDLYGNYLKAGMGTYLSPLIEFSAASKQSSQWAAGVFLKHESSWGTFENSGFPGYNNNLAKVYIKRFFDRNTIELKPYYERYDYHQYGIRLSDTTISADLTPANTLASLGTDFRFYSHIKDDDMLYKDIRLHYDYLSANSSLMAFDVSEHATGLDARLYKNVDWLRNTDKQSIGGRLATDFVARDTAFYGVMKLQPRYHLGMGIYAIKAGLNAEISVRDYTEIDFFPYLQLDINVMPDYLKIYLHLDGGVQPNTYRSILGENPFVLAYLPYEVTKQRFVKEAGFKGSIAKSLDFDVSFLNTNVENMLFFNPVAMSDIEGNILPQVDYVPVYDTVNYSRIALDMTYHLKSDLEAVFHFQYENFGMTQLDIPIMKPDFTSSLLLSYQVNEETGLHTRFLYEGKRKYYDNLAAFSMPPYPVSELPAVIDISLGGDYKINQRLSAFLDLNNILNRRNYFYAYYPTKRFNLMAGVKFRF